MTEESPHQASYCYLSPYWFGCDTPNEMQLIDGRDGSTLDLTGSLQQAFNENRLLQDPAAVTMARMNPVMQRLLNDLIASDPTPLNRNVLLRGTGWSRLFIELTGLCNERCSHCYAGSSPDVHEQLDESIVMAVLAQAYEMGFPSVQLTGGDPLLSKVCVPAATRARQLGFSDIEVYTNGLALKGALFNALRDLEVSFSFSMYGQDPLVHDVVTRVPGSHRRTLEAIERTGKAGLNMRVGIIDTGTAGFDLDATRALAMSLGVPEEGIQCDVEREVGRGDFKPKDAAANSGTTIHGGYASAFAGTAAVAYNGQIYPCIFSRDLPLGSVYDSSLSAVLEDTRPITAEPAKLFERATAWSDRLTCFKCQVRAAMLSV